MPSNKKVKLRIKKKEAYNQEKFDKTLVCLKPSQFGNNFGLDGKLEESRAGKHSVKNARKREKKRKQKEFKKNMEENLLALGNFSLSSNPKTETATTDKDGDATMEPTHVTVNIAPPVAPARYDPYKRNKKGKKDKNRRRKNVSLVPFEDRWYLISVRDGGCDGLELIDKFHHAIMKEFQYSQFTVIGKDVQFHVKGKKDADFLCGCNSLIENKAGTRVKIHKTTVEKEPYTNEQLAVVLEVLKSRCSGDKLDLSSLNTDEVLKQHNINFKLKENLGLVVYILSTFLNGNIIKFLDLSNNKLRMRSSQVRCYVDFLPNITSLNLKSNLIEKTDDLQTASDWKHVLDLNLAENIIYIAHANKTQYLEEIRMMFPKLQKLDNHEVQPSDNWDYLNNTSIPVEKGNNFDVVPPEARNIFFDFVTKYFMKMDKSRVDLREDFVADSSLTVQVPSNINTHIFADYFKACKHLKTRNKIKNRSVQVVNGADRIMQVFKQFPQTNHFQQNFVCDVIMCNVDFISFRIHGIFEETVVNRFKSFSCSFFCKIENTKLLITNCMLHIKPPSHAELKRITESKKPADNVQESSAETQNKLCKQFSDATKMNLKYSFECLVKNNWNIERAILDFNNVRATLPAEAFK